jgi:lipopolysaccharide/colanic/teichoic acid biosynthesis glycosyltransferase
MSDPLRQFLRPNSLDELPELFSILIGKMFIVGSCL